MKVYEGQILQLKSGDQVKVMYPIEGKNWCYGRKNKRFTVIKFDEVDWSSVQPRLF